MAKAFQFSYFQTGYSVRIVDAFYQKTGEVLIDTGAERTCLHTKANNFSSYGKPRAVPIIR